MTHDTWTVIGVGLALAALNLGLFAWLRAAMRDGFRPLDGESGTLDKRLRAVEREQARLYGLLKGLALVGRLPSPAPGAD